MKVLAVRRIVAIAALAFSAAQIGSKATAAQSAILNLPRASQHARSSQRIGITDITIDYHRPLVSGRKIFGGLQAYGKVWRAGANENTTFEVSDPVTIDGHPLTKGTYGLHMIPGENSWIIIFSKNSTSWGSFTYDQAEDALRVNVVPRTIQNQEALSYDFDDPKPDSVMLTMRWETVAVPFKIEVDTPRLVEESLRKQLRGRAQFEWQPWTEAGNYLLNSKLSPETALEYAERSIENEDRFENEITKATALKVLGREDEAHAAHDKAIGLGTQSQVHDFGRTLQTQGRYDEALEFFRDNIKKNPGSWIGHNEAARVAVSQRDFTTAIQEMKLAAEVAPESLKAQHLDLVRRLENNENINK
jgi:tetratricopeptide (TPR) repeat protein